MPDDWRLTNQMNFLYRATLTRAVFRETTTNDHEHCEFCWNKFGESAGLLSVGYCTIDRYHWVCDECFQDFQESFEWYIENT